MNALRAQLQVALDRNEALSNQLGRLAQERDLVSRMGFWQRLMWAIRQ